MLIEEREVLIGPDGGECEAADVVHNTGGIRHILIHATDERDLLGDKGAGEIVPPDGLHGRCAHGFAEIRADTNSDADSLNATSAKTRYGLQNAGGGDARRIKRRIGYGEHFTGEGRIGTDEAAELMQRHFVSIGQLHDANRDLRKGAEAEIGPGKVQRAVFWCLDSHPGPCAFYIDRRLNKLFGY